jgi:hypothetical protein
MHYQGAPALSVCILDRFYFIGETFSMNATVTLTVNPI